MSYDIDGDGVVGWHDMLLARTFDKKNTGHLNSMQRKAAIKEYNAGGLEKLLFRNSRRHDAPNGNEKDIKT